MTVFDPLAFAGTLREAIHGGATPPSSAQLGAWHRTTGLPESFRVVAIQHGDGPAPRLPPRHPPAALLQVHPGLAYLCCASLAPFRTLLAPRHLLVGESQPVAGVTGLVRAIQDALLSLRRRELAAVRRRRGAAPDVAAELAARAMALQRIATAQPWDGALTVWIEIVLCRHSGHLHTIRRKLVEFLALLTRDVDRGTAIAHVLRLGILRLFDTFALTALAAAFHTVVGDLVPHLPGSGPGAASPLVRRALALLHERHAGPLSLRDVAAALGVSGAHLSRRCSAELGETLTARLTGLRLARARELLAEGDGDILAVALASGFGSLEHFHRTFRRVHGITPGAWRSAHRR
jgi:AraC-like DNA-binding protein